MPKAADLLPGTLDMLILKAVSLKPLHGYGVLLRIGQISKDALNIQQGSLYPALYRLEHQGLLATRVGREREQSQGEVLHADRGRPPSPPAGHRCLGAARRRHRRGARGDSGRGVTCSPACAHFSPA